MMGGVHERLLSVGHLGEFASLLAQEASTGRSPFTWGSFGLFAVLIGVMLIAGIVGGYAGYLLGPPNPLELTKDERRWMRRRSLVTGIVASFLVPLFLSVAGAASGNQGKLIQELLGAEQAAYDAWLILIGFCLAAGVAAPRFLVAISNKLLEQLREETRIAAEKADAARREVNELDEDMVDTQRTLVRQQRAAIDDRERALLQHIQRTPVRRPSLEEIGKSLGVGNPGSLRPELEKLEEKGLVKSKFYEDGQQRWRVRTAGRALLESEDGGVAEPTR